MLPHGHCQDWEVLLTETKKVGKFAFNFLHIPALLELCCFRPVVVTYDFTAAQFTDISVNCGSNNIGEDSKDRYES